MNTRSPTVAVTLAATEQEASTWAPRSRSSPATTPASNSARSPATGHGMPIRSRNSNMR